MPLPVALRPPLEVALARPVATIPAPSAMPGGCLYEPKRTGALIALAQELPPVVLSRLTGLDISSAIAWSNAIGANSTAYAAAVVERVGMPLPVVLH
ncbi:hypothetical protein [Microbacterium sp. NPDC076895]|uniref:hypothetical protein n=1 Tax=Microbacterium sp. NPDC076895 TaxID=3154957 RepID=UPI0034202F1F